MSLSLYQKKRNFDETTEPSGKAKSSKKGLRFVIQKHDASHLHYDFRLEMEGVLKSWAVPKGPSLNPSDKRLAMMVEDHPYDYRNFEGVIPAGNYGGGTVIVWDEGTYEPIAGQGLTIKEQEKLLLQQLREGNLKIMMNGQKIQGEFALFQMKGKGDRSWILMKKKDHAATSKNILLKDQSSKTGKTLAEVAAENGTSLNHAEGSNKSSIPPKPIQLLPSKSSPTNKKKATKKSVAKNSSSKKSSTPKAVSSPVRNNTLKKKSSP